jgi:hypothetical protein
MDSKESLRIYIAVDPTKVSRCKWCGTTESRSLMGWRGSNWGGVYCSTACSLADYANRTLLIYPILVALVSFVFMRGFPISLDAYLIGIAIFAVLFSPLICFGGVGQYYRRNIPKGSRRNDVSLDTALLQVMPSTVLCPRCDANIDVTKVGEDKVYTCDYCGASGTIEIVKTRKT